MDSNESNVPYIDVEDALKRVGGNRALYKKLLGRFVDGNYVDAIENAIVSGDAEEAARQAHTLKGVSANLSLERVRALSIELEGQIRSGGDCSGGLAELKQAYAVTVGKIAEVEG